jgi:DNA-binding NtrC family response regulator
MKDKTVLFVDDEMSILNTIKRLLRNEEYTLLIASSAQEGLEVLHQHQIDLVISDMRMPNVSGSEFLAMVKDQHPKVQRMIMSGYADLESVVETINQGNISHFISKPWDNDDLKKLILDHLVNRRSLENDGIQESKEILKYKKIIFEQQQTINDLQNQLEQYLIHKDVS